MKHALALLKSGKCERDTEIVVVCPDNGDNYYDQDNCNTKIVEEFNYYVWLFVVWHGEDDENYQ